MKDFKEHCYDLREQVECLKKLAYNTMGEFRPSQSEEIHENIKLAYRHLEDARMRIGKAIQAYDGGTSCYPR